MSHQSASIIDILLGYGSRGGALYAAYRHPDNPLLLTDIRWQGPGGELIEAHRDSNDMAMVREEREAWAQVALRSTTLRPESVGPNAPWIQAPLDAREAYDLATRARLARESSVPPSAHSIGGGASFSGGSMRSPAPPYGPPSGRAPSSAPDYPTGARPSIDAHHGYDSFESIEGAGGARAHVPESSQITGSWPNNAFYASQSSSQPSQEIIVIPCIEIEMPSLMPDSPQDFTRDFARDVALNFNRAARAIPQTRETRGWMHNGRMTLGALMALGSGARAATRGEMDLAADTLASALANRTLPYSRMRFADPAEWAQGIPLPE